MYYMLNAEHAAVKARTLTAAGIRCRGQPLGSGFLQRNDEGHPGTRPAADLPVRLELAGQHAHQFHAQTARGAGVEAWNFRPIKST